MGNALTLLIDDLGAHSASLVCTNLADGSPAKGVSISYGSSDSTIAAVDPSTGAIVLVGIGSCSITGAAARGNFSHSDSALLTVAADPDTGDFSATLTLV